MNGAAGIRAKEGWRPIAAAFAVFAILIQALLPAAAQAAHAAGASVVICAVDGTHAVRVAHLPGPHKGFAGLPCPDCLTAAVAVVLSPPFGLGPAPTAYAARAYTAEPAVEFAPARAPPRPRGQGPPAA